MSTAAAPAATDPRRTGRSVVALFAGLMTTVVPSVATDAIMHATGVFAEPGQPMSSGLWLLALGYRIVCGITGSYVAARLAPRGPMAHALTLGAIGLAVSIAGVLATWDKGEAFGPKWYALGLAFTVLPCAWVGGRLGGREA